MTPTYGDLFGGSGATQTGFGFTGEVTDASGLVYLRARYYLPTLGVFPSLDPVEEGNRYGYVGGDVVNRVDPSGMIGERPGYYDYCAPGQTISGLCPPKSGGNSCERFISELECSIEEYTHQIDGLPFVENVTSRLFTSAKRSIIAFWAERYAGIPFNIGEVILPELGIWGLLKNQRAGIEKFPVPYMGDPWKDTILDKGDSAQDGRRMSYGFRRPYYGNTHHYMAFLKLAMINNDVASVANYVREAWLSDLSEEHDRWQRIENSSALSTDKDDAAARYAMAYLDAINDLYVLNHVSWLGFGLTKLFWHIKDIPNLIKDEMCATDARDVWKFESAIHAMYFLFPSYLYPREDLRMK